MSNSSRIKSCDCTTNQVIAYAIKASMQIGYQIVGTWAWKLGPDIPDRMHYEED